MALSMADISSLARWYEEISPPTQSSAAKNSRICVIKHWPRAYRPSDKEKALGPMSLPIGRGVILGEADRDVSELDNRFSV